ncbi:MAG TPA: bacillithiol biosynthesis deacetylase BshB1, partial [Microscillaceae bacterium]|nr:bacillithiol biosynthesis deacetylase BshB1 [Microscillaceae bacterium]
IETLHPQTGQPQPAWRPRAVYHFIHDYLLLPTLVVDVTDFWETKIESVKAYKTQFFDPESQEPTTPISTPDYFDFLVGRAKDMGRSIGAALGEGFIKETPVQMNDFFGCAW